MMNKYSIGSASKIFRAILVFALMLLVMKVFGIFLSFLNEGFVLYKILQVVRWGIPVMALIYIGDLVLVSKNAPLSNPQDPSPEMPEGESAVIAAEDTKGSRERLRLTAFLYVGGGVITLPALLFGLFMLIGHTNSFLQRLGVKLLGLGVMTLPLVLLISGIMLFAISLSKASSDTTSSQVIGFWKKAPLANALSVVLGFLLARFF